jgi:DNA-binding transcriptional regulator YhcF (GntR family)
MYLTKNTAKILKFFVGKINETFTLREVARQLKMHVSLVHRAIQPLIQAKIIESNKHKNLKLNYKGNHETIIFAEYLRREDYFNRFKEIKLFTQEILKKNKQESFVLIVFGSSVESNKPRDIDILLIVEGKEKINFYEKFLDNITSNYSSNLECSVISFESVYEMLLHHDEKNIMNEILNKHIILYGAELFYRFLERGRL